MNNDEFNAELARLKSVSCDYSLEVETHGYVAIRLVFPPDVLSFDEAEAFLSECKRRRISLTIEIAQYVPPLGAW